MAYKKIHNIQIESCNYENTEFILLVNGIDETGESMTLAEVIDAAEDELVSWQGFTHEEAEETVNDLIQESL